MEPALGKYNEEALCLHTNHLQNIFLYVCKWPHPLKPTIKISLSKDFGKRE